MSAGPTPSRDEVRRALALIRRLKQPARDLLDLLAGAEAYVTRPAPVDALVAPPAPPELLMRLLGGGGNAGSEPRRDRPAPLQPPLRSLSQPAPLAPAGRTGDRPEPVSDPSGATPSRTTRRTTAETALPTPARDPDAGKPATDTRKPRGSTLTGTPRKPIGLKDVANMRRAQRRNLALPRSADAGPDHAPAPNETRAIHTSGAVIDPPRRPAEPAPHALADLARRRARAGLALPVPAATQPVETAAMSPPAAPVTAADAPPRSPGQSTPSGPANLQHPQNPATSPEFTVSGRTRISDGPDLPRTDPATSAQPDALGAHRGRRDTEPHLGDLAWRNGVEPR
ncbi:hypothetical protein [Pukyongiella litopenaei]|uniref:Uncharacterized protein n=1 Tax=Pukyongiella litopenaei TaxID=2605946 RepID=A0A2S0MKJ3_9RHOB|nr:hypothetical protein [Pukyongiella litopenaei]AVO36347.2 hypothetical protein C6Y53_00555 [Pukyongiella litopenaei]